MRLRFATGTALAALSVVLQACASTEVPPPPTALARPAEGTEILPGPVAGPSDLESAILQAQLLRRAGNYDGAVRTLGQLVLIAPDDARVLGEYGKTLVAKGESEDAIAFLNRAIELQPGDWSLFSAQGVAFDQMGNYPSAQTSYNRALALQPGEPSVLSNAGLSRMQAGDLAGAEAYLSQAMQQGGDDARIASNLALVRRLTDTSNASADTQYSAIPATTAPQAALPPQAAIEQREIAAPPAGARPQTAMEALAADPTVMMAPIPPETPPVPRATPVAPAEQVTADASQTSSLRRLNPTD